MICIEETVRGVVMMQFHTTFRIQQWQGLGPSGLGRVNLVRQLETYCHELIGKRKDESIHSSANEKIDQLKSEW